MGRKKFQDQGMMMQQKEQQPEEEVEQEPQVQKHQEREFNKGGGGGGPPFIFGVQMVSLTQECKPDPEDPSREICNQVKETKKYNPKTGDFDTSTQSSNYSPENRLARFGGGGGRGGLSGSGMFGSGGDDNRWNRNSVHSSNKQPPVKIAQQQEQIKQPSFGSSVMRGLRSFKDQISNWWNYSSRSQKSKGFIETPNRQNNQRNINFQQRYQPPPPPPQRSHIQRRDPFQQFEDSFFSGKPLLGDKFFDNFFGDEFRGFQNNSNNDHNSNNNFFISSNNRDFDHPFDFFAQQMSKNDPFFERANRDDFFDLNNNNNKKFFVQRSNNGQNNNNNIFISDNLNNAFNEQENRGSDPEPQEFVKQETNYQSKSNSKIYDV